MGDTTTTPSDSDRVHRAVAGPIALVGVLPASDVVAEIGLRTYLHAGPPLVRRPIEGPMRGALLGALLFEGQARDVADAERLLDEEHVDLLPCHAVGGVGPMAGVVTPSTPVIVVEHESGQRAFAPLVEGLGRAMRFGNHDSETLAHLGWLRDQAAPVLHDAIRLVGGVDTIELLAQGLRRGDECHNRNVATSAALLARLAAPIVQVAPSQEAALAVLDHLANNIQFSLSVSMATGKLMADRLHGCGVPGLVTAIASNGQHTGIRVSGTSGWHVCDAPVQELTLLEGFEAADASPLTGDSAVVETVGLGASALSAGLGLAQALGMASRDAYAHVDEMRSVSVTESNDFLLPHEDLRGTPVGMRVALIVETGVAPMFSTGYAHRTPGVGRVGAGLVRVPLTVFADALNELRSQEETPVPQGQA